MNQNPSLLPGSGLMVNSGTMKILAIIPAHNEATRILPVIQVALTHLPVLVVDDGSSDTTSAIAHDAGAMVLRQVPNQGKGKALKAGFRRALDENFDAVLTLDADGQHDPAEIPLFLEAFAARGSDLIIGSRDFSQMPFSRRFANTSGRLLFSRAMGQTIHDNQSGYRLVSRRLAQAALASQHGGFEFEVDMLVICVQHGWRLDWVPIRTIYGSESSHISPLKHTGRFLRLVWKTFREVRSSSPKKETHD
jgi:glycosyltransferase involved in cell wall biosynthesis